MQVAFLNSVIADQRRKGDDTTAFATKLAAEK